MILCEYDPNASLRVCDDTVAELVVLGLGADAQAHLWAHGGDHSLELRIWLRGICQYVDIDRRPVRCDQIRMNIPKRKRLLGGPACDPFADKRIEFNSVRAVWVGLPSSSRTLIGPERR